MKKANMLCLGPKKNLSSPRVELTAQGVTQHTDVQSQVWYHSAIQKSPYLIVFEFIIPSVYLGRSV